MALIGLEISDAGILAAGGSPAGLLDLDGKLRESPGFALPQKKGLLVGRTAESKAHLFPRQIMNRFWDQLNTEPLGHTGRQFPLNHAEIVYRHLSSIWQQLQSRADEIVMAVPSFFEREQLGLLLGIAQELGMPVKGFMPLSLAASADCRPGKMLMYVDIHLHRIGIDYLEQADLLTVRDFATTVDKGLHHLSRELVEMIARRFVRFTRFDPYHQAASEQELYDRLPGILSHLKLNSSMIFEIAAGSSSYSITLERDDIISTAEPVYREVLRLIKRMQYKRGTDQTPLILQLSHRMARLPGFKEALAALKEVEIIELDRGAAAIGLPQIWHELAARDKGQGTSFFTSRPWQQRPQVDDHRNPSAKAANTRPTHLLYRSIAYPISEKPLTIGCAKDGQDNDITISGEISGVHPRHCTVERRGRDITLTNPSARATFVDEKQVNGSISLKLGQIIRVGTPGETLQLIACIQTLSE